ncbi:MAG TPA: ParB/RepB/Spo0J family partition protein [Gemmataceae bacterium]|nr:ParB/RepB/Spo0J family partition protein [Gemmataceae bacterium]
MGNESQKPENASRVANKLVHKHPAWLLPVAKDKRNRTGSEYQEYFERFTADVKEHGVLQAVIAVEEGEVARVIDGQTRVLAALLAGLESIPILIYSAELTESQVEMAKLVSNAQRRDFTDAELAPIYLDLMSLNSWNQAQLAAHIHASPAKVSKVLAISKNLCPEVQAMVTAGEVAPRAAYAISRLSDVPAQIDLAKKCKDGFLCVEGIEHQVSKALGKRDKKPKPMKIVSNGVTLLFNGKVIDAWKAVRAAMDEAVKKLEREGLPEEILPGLLR